MLNKKSCSECVFNKSCLNLLSLSSALSSVEISSGDKRYLEAKTEMALATTCKEYKFDINIARGIFGVQELFQESKTDVLKKE